MPCDQIRTVTLNIGKCDKTLLSAAMQELGYATGWTYNEQSQTILIKGRTAGNVEVNQIKQAYSRQVIQSQAQRFGWKLLKQEGNQFTYQKR